MRHGFEWLCKSCGHSERTSGGELIKRLQTIGLLKRDKESGPDVAIQLVAAAADRFHCPQCGQSGFLPTAVSDDDEWGDPVKLCSACGQAIPPERLELFPASELCAACQQGIDRGTGPGQHDDYCNTCGERMVLKSGKRTGVVRYELVCPVCHR